PAPSTSATSFLSVRYVHTPLHIGALRCCSQTGWNGVRIVRDASPRRGAGARCVDGQSGLVVAGLHAAAPLPGRVDELRRRDAGTDLAGHPVPRRDLLEHLLVLRAGRRSEERRVGEEWRSPWS